MNKSAETVWNKRVKCPTANFQSGDYLKTLGYEMSWTVNIIYLKCLRRTYLVGPYLFDITCKGYTFFQITR